MKYKALILDLDDTTLLHGIDNMPSDRVTQAIARAKDRIHISIATARTLTATLPVLEHLSLSGPCIVTNGTQIYDPLVKKVIHSIGLPLEAVPAIYEICKKHKIRAFYSNGLEDNEYTGGKVPEDVLSIYVEEVKGDQVDAIVDEMRAFPGINVQKLTAWDKRFMSIDVTHKSASKLYGIYYVAKLLELKTEEIIGVGDGYNDFPLLMACGLKIAMGNAVPELKAIADFIAPTVEEDGVATVIEKFILTS